MMLTRPYKDEFLISVFDRPELPKYLADLVDRQHSQLAAGIDWMCDMSIRQGWRTCGLLLTSESLMITTSHNGETDVVTHPVEAFSTRGGIADILITLVEGGALPASAGPDEITLDEG